MARIKKSFVRFSHVGRRLLLAAMMLNFQFSPLYSQTNTGYASFYGKRFTGQRTASGEKLNNDSLTCAHRTLPFGTYLRVKSLSTQKEVVVRVNDRGPFVRGRIIDLTQRAASELGILRHGTGEVSIEVVHPIIPPLALPDQEASQPSIPKIWEMADIENMTQWPAIEPVWPLEP